MIENRLNKICIAIFLLFSISVGRASPQKLLDNISKNYLSDIPFVLDFRVKNINEEGKSVSQTKGEFIINEAKEFRVNYPSEDILYDGKWLWTYNKVNQQTVVEKFNPSSTLSLIYDIINGNLGSFNIKDATQNGAIWELNLEPQNKNNFFQKIELTANEKGRVVEKAKYIDYRGKTIVVEFLSQQDTVIQDSVFYDVRQSSKENLIDLRP